MHDTRRDVLRAGAGPTSRTHERNVTESRHTALAIRTSYLTRPSAAPPLLRPSFRPPPSALRPPSCRWALSPSRLPLDATLYIRVIYTSVPVLSPFLSASLRPSWRSPPSHLSLLSFHLLASCNSLLRRRRSLRPDKPHPLAPSCSLPLSLCLLSCPPPARAAFQIPPVAFDIRLRRLPPSFFHQERSFHLFSVPGTGTVGLIDPRLCTQMSCRVAPVSLALSGRPSLSRLLPVVAIIRRRQFIAAPPDYETRGSDASSVQDRARVPALRGGPSVMSRFVMHPPPV